MTPLCRVQDYAEFGCELLVIRGPKYFVIGIVCSSLNKRGEPICNRLLTDYGHCATSP
jgi:hypothetical protein